MRDAPGKSARLEQGNMLVPRLLGTLTAAVAALLIFGCGSPSAILQVSAPSSAIAGSPFTVTVTAMANGSRDTIFNSVIRFTCSDSAAVLPPEYEFTAADAGSHTFTSGVTFMTPGSQSITATAPLAPSITGTANVTVSATLSVTQFR